MDYCGPIGLGLHEFNRWPGYAREAAVVWAQQRRVDEAEHEARRARTCGRCGTDPEEWLDADGAPKHSFEEPYVAEVVECRGCRARDAAWHDLEQAFKVHGISDERLREKLGQHHIVMTPTGRSRPPTPD